MPLDPAPVVQAIETAIRSESDLPADVARDVAFHMTDWLDDLAAYSEFCAHPERLSPPEINQLLMRFLAHVPNHVAAACKLLMGIPTSDVFAVGSTTDDDG